MAWLASNWQGLLGIIATLLGVAVAILHLTHTDAVAAQIKSIEDIIYKMSGGGK